MPAPSCVHVAANRSSRVESNSSSTDRDESLLRSDLVDWARTLDCLSSLALGMSQSWNAAFVHDSTPASSSVGISAAFCPDSSGRRLCCSASRMGRSAVGVSTLLTHHGVARICLWRGLFSGATTRADGSVPSWEGQSNKYLIYYVCDRSEKKTLSLSDRPPGEFPRAPAIIQADPHSMFTVKQAKIQSTVANFSPHDSPGKIRVRSG